MDSAWVRVVAVAEAQWGVITRRELKACGLSDARLSRLLARGYLHRLYSAVYSVGHTALGTRGRLMGALLHAGDGSMLTGPVGVWWWGMIPHEPRLIHIVSPRRTRSTPQVRIKHAPDLEASVHNGLRVANPGRALIDFAPLVSVARLRKALSEALYLRIRTVDAIDAELRSGLTGSAAVRAALERHRSGPTRSRSEKEEVLMLICERGRLPMPELNAMLAGHEVDAVWRELRLAVEIDGPGHAEVSRLISDREREMAIRAAGFDLIRYSWVQVTRRRDAISAELRREVARRSP